VTRSYIHILQAVCCLQASAFLPLLPLVRGATAAGATAAGLRPLDLRRSSKTGSAVGA
jgi:hypothetical protein